jgi:hypothetical protein
VSLREHGGGVAEQHLVNLVQLLLASDEVSAGGKGQAGEAFSSRRRRLGQHFLESSQQAGNIYGRNELALDGFERRRLHLLPTAFVEQGDDVPGSVSFVARPQGLLPVRGQNRQHHAAGVEPGLDFVVPVEAVADADSVEPDSVARLGERVVKRLRLGQVGFAGVADEAIVGHGRVGTIMSLRPA